MPKKALGKGLGAIFGDESKEIRKPVQGKPVLKEEKTSGSYEEIRLGNPAEAVNPSAPASSSASAPENVSRETSVRVSLIEPNRKQPRKEFREESLRELADSMKKYGVLQPLLVKQKGQMYEIIAGERRWRAAKLAGLREVPVIIRDFAPQESAEIAIIENIQREDLGPVEEARAYRALMEEYGLTQEEVAEKVSKNRSTITNSLRLLQLSDRVQELLSEGKLSAGHARCLIPPGGGGRRDPGEEPERPGNRKAGEVPGQRKKEKESGRPGGAGAQHVSHRYRPEADRKPQYQGPDQTGREGKGQDRDRLLFQ